jgi:hypothetical protein
MSMSQITAKHLDAGIVYGQPRVKSLELLLETASMFCELPLDGLTESINSSVNSSHTT